MNILQVVSTLSLRAGGPAKAVVDLSRELARQGERVSIFSADCGPEEPDSRARFQEGSVEICRFGPKWPGRYGYSPLFRQELKRRIKDFDIVHVHGLWTYPTWAASQISAANQIPYFIRPCGMLDRYSLAHHRIRKKIYYQWIERWNLKKAAAIHFTSEEERNRSVYPAEIPTRVLPLGIHLDDYSPHTSAGEFEKKYPHFAGKLMVLFLGRINFKKGLDVLVDAFAEVVETIPAVLVIAGPDDEGYGRKLSHWISKKGIKDHVTVLDFVKGSEKLELLWNADLFCLPSRQENFGLAVLEAMAAGLPVVISEHVNLCREIEEAGAGLVTPLDPKKLAAAFSVLLMDHPLRQSMGEMGKTLVKEKYQWKHVVLKWLQAYQNGHVLHH